MSTSASDLLLPDFSSHPAHNGKYAPPIAGSCPAFFP
ncbi:MAG: hypothetical protein DVB28_001996, partial [Verrucomicrobia bacterium]